MPDPTTPGQTESQQFAQQAQRGNAGLARELWHLLRTTRKWWLAPIILVLLALGLLAVLGSSALAPFIYPFF